MNRQEACYSRRSFLWAVLAAVVLAALPAARAIAAPPSVNRGATPLLKPINAQTICPYSAEHPRHDHQLIFPLSDDRLMFVWCEYYANRPSLVARTATNKQGRPHDAMPCRISAKISTDRCRSWGDRFILQENVWKRNVKHPNLIRLPSGEILFFFVGWDSNSQRNIFMKRSKNECESWSETVQISRPGFYCNNHERAIRLRSGRILLPAHGAFANGTVGVPYQGHTSKLHSFVYYSDDGFRTWHESKNTMTAPGRGAHEPTIVQLKDGRLLCLLRTTTGRLYQAFSTDEGITWSKPEATDLPSPDSEALVTRIPTTGDLLLVWNHVESHGNRPRTPLTAAISKDEGQTWEHFHDIDARSDYDAAYPSVFFQGDEAVVGYNTRPVAWRGDGEVMLKIFKIAQFYAESDSP